MDDWARFLAYILTAVVSGRLTECSGRFKAVAQTWPCRVRLTDRGEECGESFTTPELRSFPTFVHFTHCFSEEKSSVLLLLVLKRCNYAT